MADPTAPNADRFAPLDPALAAVWSRFGSWDHTYFPNVVGLVVDELRKGYARVRVPFRDELRNPEGFVHGGVLATALDVVNVPAIGTHYDAKPTMLTLQINVNFLGAVSGQDVVAEGWVEQAGRTIAFCRSEARAADGTLAATATSTFKVRLG